MFAKQKTEKEFEEDSKDQLFKMLKSDNKEKPNYNRDDLSQRKRIFELKQQVLEMDEESELSEEQQNIRDLVNLYSKYDILFTDFNYNKRELEKMKEKEEIQFNKIRKLKEDIDELDTNCKQLISETNDLDNQIENLKKQNSKIKNDFYMYKFRIVSIIVLIFTIIIAIYLNNNSYIW